MVQNDNLFDAVELNNFIGQKILSTIEEAIHKEIGFKQFCYDLQKDERQIRDALNGNNKYFSVTWLPLIFQKAPQSTQKLINLFCDIAKLSHPEPVKEKTIEEELAELKEFKARVMGLTRSYDGN